MSGFYRQGEIISVIGESADVRLSLEGFCSGEHKCLFAAFTQNRPSARNEVRAYNPIGARKGDRVVVEITSPGFYRAFFFVFIFPLLALLGGGLAGYQLAIERGVAQSTDLYAVVGAVLFFIFALLAGKLADRRVMPQYVIRKGMDQSLACEGCVLKSK